MKKFLIYIVSFISLCTAQYRYGTTAANFLEIGVGSQAVAMGEAYVSMADDAISAYWNPAGLAFVTGLEMGFTSQDWVAGIRHFSTAAALRIQSYGTISMSFTDVDYGDIEVTNVQNQEGTGEYYNANEYAASLAYAKSLVNWFSFGIAVKRVSSSIWHSSASATAVDLGVLVNTDFFSATDSRKDGMRIGMSISNYGSRMKYYGIDLLNPIDILENENGNYADVIGQFRTQAWELPLIFRLGIAVKPIVYYNQSLTIAIDVLHPNNNSESINSGLQYSYTLAGGNTFFVRSGIKGIGITQAHEKSQFLGINVPFLTAAYGVGFEKKMKGERFVGFDYSYQSIGVLGDVSMITIKLNLF